MAIYIPPENGKAPTFRVINFSDIARRAWGPEWGVPDIVYTWSDGQKMESSDRTDTGIYRR